MICCVFVHIVWPLYVARGAGVVIHPSGDGDGGGGIQNTQNNKRPARTRRRKLSLRSRKLKGKRIKCQKDKSGRGWNFFLKFFLKFFFQEIFSVIFFYKKNLDFFFGEMFFSELLSSHSENEK